MRESLWEIGLTPTCYVFTMYDSSESKTFLYQDRNSLAFDGDGA